MRIRSLLILLIYFISCQPRFDKNEIQQFVAVDYENPSTKEIDDFERGLNQLISQYKISGLSVVLIKNNHVIYKNGFGHSDIESNIYATSKTPYRIASLTKPISSTLLLQLKEQEKLDLDDTLKNFVPEYEDYFLRSKNYVLSYEPQWAHLVENYDYTRNDITVRHHLTHTSEEIPGTYFKYNGFVFGFLSRVIEEKSGRKFDVLLKEMIFVPCEMENTLASQSHFNKPIVVAALAKPYQYLNEEFQQSEYPKKNVNAGAGIISSVEDLAKFDIAMNNDKLVHRTTKELAWQNQVTNTGDSIPYGLGWFVHRIDNTKIVWHYGWQPKAYSGLYIKIPGKNQSIIILSNCENLSAPFWKLGMNEDLTKSPFARLYLNTFNK